jgi:phosphoribosyl-dephospho-CoA transferase
MYSRHDLLWLNPQGWDEALAQLSNEMRSPVARWQRANWPVVARRRDGGLPAGFVCTGIPLPPDRETGVKPRVALRIAASGIDRRTAPLALARALPAAPLAWRGHLAPLAEAGMRVFGSLAMQAFTGLPYLTDSSDIDVLFTPADRNHFEEGLSLLTEASAHVPLDGEVVFPGGAAVAWKEWRDACQAGRKVLVKTIDEVRLSEPDSMLATLQAR